MNTPHKGFVAPLLLALIALILIGGGAYVYTQKKQENPPVTGNVALPQAISTTPATTQATATSQTANWNMYTKFDPEFSFKYPSKWHVTEYTRNEGGSNGVDKSIVAVRFILSQTGGTDVNSNGSFSFDPNESPDYVLVYREFMAQPECTFLTQKTSALSESGKVLHNPDWPDAKCIEPFGTKLPYAIFTPSKNTATLEVFDRILSTFKSNP